MTKLAADEAARRKNLAAWQELLERILELGLPHGREQSFKMTPGRLLTDRLLVGVQRSHLPQEQLFTLADALGMSPAGQARLRERLPQANAVFFATEESGPIRLHKVYLEFWDEVRRAVAAGARTPQLLHLGVKWSSERPGHHEVAQYHCHPLLGLRDILRRMRALYPPEGGCGSQDCALGIARRAAMAAPTAGFLYLEVSEDGNPRRSFDLNLYKSGLRVSDVAGELRQAATRFGIGQEQVESQLQALGERALGHVSGGTDRHGAEFLSIYAELAPLPDA